MGPGQCCSSAHTVYSKRVSSRSMSVDGSFHGLVAALGHDDFVIDLVFVHSCKALDRVPSFGVKRPGSRPGKSYR